MARRMRRSLAASVPVAAPADAMTATADRTSQASGWPGKASRPRNIEPPRMRNDSRSIREAELRPRIPPTTVEAISDAPDDRADRRIANPADSPRTEIA